ncbi:MAG TPA: choice-of-anchor Q domain-containing protein, partial [Candidatus Saccharimonadales bacterium]|nr:choice-of-anchor Q domain-containing protein [Candidatus Saccharimonadales bacterium]
SQAATNPATTSTANVFVSPNGSDSGANCLRFTTAQTNPDPTGASLCATLGQAYALAQPGDTVEVEAGNYPAQAVCKSGAPQGGNLIEGACSVVADKGIPAVTFKANGSVTVMDQFNLGQNGGIGYPAPSNLVFNGINVNGQVAIYSDPSAPASNITFENGHFYKIGNQKVQAVGLINVGIAHNVNLSHMEIGPAVGDMDGIQTGTPDSGTLQQANNFTLEDSTVHDLYDSCQYVPASIISTYGSCSAIGYGDIGSAIASLSSAIDSSQTTFNVSAPGPVNSGWSLSFGIQVGSEDMKVTGGFGTTAWTVTRGWNGTTAASHSSGDAVTIIDYGQDHVDGIHTWGSDNFSLLRNRWYAIGANGDPVGQVIFMAADPKGLGAYFNHVLIENNSIYSGDTNNNDVSIGLTSLASSSAYIGDTQILYNTIWGENTSNGGSLSLSGFSPAANVVVAGNIVRSFLSNDRSTTCTLANNAGGTIQPIYAANEWGGNEPGKNYTPHTCSASDAPLATPDPTFITANSLNPNEQLVQNGQWAIDHGESTYCPPTDVVGTQRPQGGACDVGAYEVIPTANVWVSTTGDDSTCARGDQTKPCATVQKACSLALGGDVIQIAAGTYTSGFNLSGCNPSSNITYKNAPGSNVFFAGDSSITNTSNVTLEGDQIGHGVGFSLGKTGISGTDSAATSNINWNSVNLYCQNNSAWRTITSTLTGESACNSSLSISGNVNQFTWNGGDQEDWATCYTSCTTNRGINPNANAIADGDTDGTQTLFPRNITIERVVTKNYFSLDNNGSAGDHSESWIITSGSHLNFINDSWTDCAPPAGTGYAVNNSCNTSYIFFGQSPDPGGAYTTPTADYVTFTGNIIAPGHGQAAVHFDYDYPQGNEFHTSWLYNSIDGTFLIKGNNSNTPMDPGSVILTGSNMVFVGNIAPRASYDDCFSAATYSNNLWFRSDGAAIKCGASDIEEDNTAGTGIWANPATYDFTLLFASPAIDAGESTYCPSTDINGTSRPQGPACDAGADEYTTGGGSITPGDLNSDGQVNITDLS